MRRLYFNEILILSERERKARRVKFDSSLNVVSGPNGVGKSFLIKSIFYCLGAEPPVSERWKETEPTILLRLNVDGVNYTILREDKRISLFDSNDNLLHVYKSITNELSPAWADICDFRLLLENKSGKLINATPAFYFLPFYIDQENGWKTPPLHSFQKLEQFKSPTQEVIYYHSGIRPNEYYLNKMELYRLKEEERDLQTSRKGLETIRADLQERLSLLEFTLDKESYADELRELVVEAGKLKKDLDRFRTRIAAMENTRHDLKLQIEITRSALDELRKDYQYVTSKLHDHYITCPMCGTEHENSFGERFQLAQDEDNLDELYKQLVEELASVEEKIKKEKERFSAKSDEIDKIDNIMSVKKHEVELRDIIESEGKREIKKILKADSDALLNRLALKNEEIELFKTELAILTDKDRKDEIESYYDEKISKYIHELDVDDAEASKYKNIQWKVKLSGSQIPRGLLAYYFALVHTCHTYGTAILPPFVIDAPKQQEMDDFNYPKALNFIKNNQPESTQLIIGIVDDAGVNMGGHRIELCSKGSLLQSDMFKDVQSEINDFSTKTLFHIYNNKYI